MWTQVPALLAGATSVPVPLLFPQGHPGRMLWPDPLPSGASGERRVSEPPLAQPSPGGEEHQPGCPRVPGSSPALPLFSVGDLGPIPGASVSLLVARLPGSLYDVEWDDTGREPGAWLRCPGELPCVVVAVILGSLGPCLAPHLLGTSLATTAGPVVGSSMR